MSNTVVLRFTLAVLSLCAILGLLTVVVGCSSSQHATDLHQLVIAIDRTGVAQAETWQQEVAAQTQASLERGLADGVDRVALLSIGSDVNQTATAATADLADIEGNTEAKRDAARQALVEDVVSAAGQIAAQPVDTVGTDVFAALDQAASLCHAPEVSECSVLVISDLEDQRVTGAPSVEVAIDQLRSLMPDLTGMSVEVSGLGASGADAATVQKVEAVWRELLDLAGAVDIRIARSL